LLSKNLKIKIHKTIILPVGLYGCETWPVTLREERRLRVFQYRVLRRVFGPKKDRVTGEWSKLHNEELNDLYSLHQYCAGGKIMMNELDGMWRVRGRIVCTECWWRSLRERGHWGDQDVDGRILTLTLLTWNIGQGPNNDSKWQMGFNSALKRLRWIFRKLEGVVGTGWCWIRIGTVGG
jgi:hypothetical protein